MGGVLLLLALAAAPVTSSVGGRVTLGGLHPPDGVAWVTRGGGCPALIPDDRIAVIGDGSLRDAVVLLEPEAGSASLPRQPAPDALVRGLYCAVSPRVQVVRPGALLAVRVEPRSGHRFHAYRDGNSLWGGVLDPADVRVLRDPGVVDLRCDAGHEWEVAWIYITDAPLYAVTDGAGRFQIDGVPPGAYRLRAWHPYLGHIEAPIRVDPTMPSGLTVAFSGRGIVETLYGEGGGD